MKCYDGAMETQRPRTIPEVTDATAPLFAAHPSIDCVYLFGSAADGTADDRSDFDFGVLCSRETDPRTCRFLSLELAGRLPLALRTDRVDVVVLNTTASLELRFAVIEDGVPIYNRGVDIDEYEMRVRHEYFDYMAMRRRLGLSEA